MPKARCHKIRLCCCIKISSTLTLGYQALISLFALKCVTILEDGGQVKLP